MAIFYDYIKGCKAGTTNKNSGNWSWIEWTDAQPPIIYTNTSATKPDTSWGNIITSGGNAQNINKNLTFLHSSLNFKSSDNSTRTFSWSINQINNVDIYDLRDSSFLLMRSNRDGIRFEVPITSNQSATFVQDVTLQGLLQLTGNAVLTAENYLKIGANAPIDSGSKTGNVYIEKKCQALYFNSTSDARAKKDIQPLFTSVLDVIKSLQVYRFSYKADETHEPVIGLLAQEANQFEIEDFSLVSNAAASGENGDYMSIKESKLVYILWKAIQEQQEQIEALQAEIEELKK